MSSWNRYKEREEMQSDKEFFTEAIKAISLDVDGVFTTGDILVTESGKLLRTMNTKDGYAFRQLISTGFPISIITGGKSEGVVRRFRDLGLEDVFTGAEDKVPVFLQWCKDKNLDPSSVLYVGDDIPDRKVMEVSGFSACPADAVPEVKEKSGYISPYDGGRGCIRDICEQILKSRNLWNL